MKMVMIGWFTILPAAVAMAQDDAACGQERLWQFLANVLPVLLILGLLYFIFRKASRKNQPYIARSQEHMDKMEQKYDRIIELLEKLTSDRK